MFSGSGSVTPSPLSEPLFRFILGGGVMSFSDCGTGVIALLGLGTTALRLFEAGFRSDRALFWLSLSNLEPGAWF